MADPDKSPFDFLHEADEPQAAAAPGPAEANAEKKGVDFSFFDDLAAAPAADPIGAPADAAMTPPAEPAAAADNHDAFNFAEEPKTGEPDVAPPQPFATGSHEPEPTMNFVPRETTEPGLAVDEYGLAPIGTPQPASGADAGSPFHFEALAGPGDPLPSYTEPPQSPEGTPRWEEDNAGLEESPADEAAVAAGVAAFAAGAMAGDAMAPAAPVEEPLPPDPEIAETQPTPAPLADDDPQMQTYGNLCKHIRQSSQLAAIEAVLDWDERCMMPVAGAENRAEQIMLLSGILHDRLTDPKIGQWLDEIKGGPLNHDRHDDFGATLYHIRRNYEKRTKLPKELVEELAHTAAIGQHVWQEARAKDDFASFAPILTKMVGLKQQQADALGFAETRYDALLDDFEPGELTSRVTQVLGALRDELVPLVAQVREGGRTPDMSVLQRRFPIETQRSFGRAAAEKIGFDFQRGRLDVTAHPFCTGLGPNDCRITTRYDEHFFNAGFFGILHEAGHGIYDQGLRSEQYGLPMGEAVSMGIHESQSRLWEILVGRSLPYWKNTYASARAAFPEALRDVTLGRFFFAINDVRPSLIRVEADEFTYNLHILIRFELEQALISGDLAVADLPGAWREKYQQYLGIECPNDADGVLQDIHWSAGLFGYFPSYSLGNLYASQFFEAADQELGALERRLEKGQFDLLKKWLTHKIHRQGQRYSSSELCERVTGKALSHEPLMRHLREKYDLLYNPAATAIDDLDVAPLETEVGGDVGVGVMEPPAAEGYELAADAAPGDFAAGGFGGTTTAPARPVYKKKSGGGMVTLIVTLVGIVGGGVIGITLGLWILLWLKGPHGDLLKIRHKVPSWMLPPNARPEAESPEEPAEPAEPTSRLPAGRDDATTVQFSKVSRELTARVLAAARSDGHSSRG
jgi:carboxypeptidase Taq